MSPGSVINSGHFKHTCHSHSVTFLRSLGVPLFYAALVYLSVLHELRRGGGLRMNPTPESMFKFGECLEHLQAVASDLSSTCGQLFLLPMLGINCPPESGILPLKRVLWPLRPSANDRTIRPVTCPGDTWGPGVPRMTQCDLKSCQCLSCHYRHALIHF